MNKTHSYKHQESVRDHANLTPGELAESGENQFQDKQMHNP